MNSLMIKLSYFMTPHAGKRAPSVHLGVSILQNRHLMLPQLLIMDQKSERSDCTWTSAGRKGSVHEWRRLKKFVTFLQAKFYLFSQTSWIRLIAAENTHKDEWWRRHQPEHWPHYCVQQLSPWTRPPWSMLGNTLPWRCWTLKRNTGLLH